MHVPKIPRIGYLGNDPVGAAALHGAFVGGLRDRGWEDGRNVTIEYRWSKGNAELSRQHAAELVSLGVDLIFAPNSALADVAHRATDRIPIVFALNPDPVGFGHVASLARPGGNMTGMGQPNNMAAKLLEQLVYAVPTVTRVALLWESTTPSHPPALDVSRDAARALRVQAEAYRAQTPAEFDAAFVDLVRDGCDSVLVFVGNPSFNSRIRLAELAMVHRLPIAAGQSEFAEAGFLLSYAANYADLFRRATGYIDRILRGAKPADLPVELAERFDFVINLKTARELGLTVPPSVLQQATELIQ
jgi:putative ABC transport system substrate-binding protein